MLAEVRRDASIGATALVGGLTGKLDQSLFGPFLAQVVVTRRCNRTCGYCSEYDRSSAPVPSEQLGAWFDQLKRHGTFAVELTGGEPLLDPEIYEPVRHCRQLRFFKTMLIGNGYPFDRERVRRLNDAGLQELRISIDGIEPNQATVKVLRPLRRKLEAIAAEARFRVVINSVVGSAPPAEVLEVIDFARGCGFVPRVQLLHDDSGQFELRPGEVEPIDEIRRRLGRRFMEAGDYRRQLLERGAAPFACRAGARYLYVDEHGIARWCSQTRTAWYTSGLRIGGGSCGEGCSYRSPWRSASSRS